MNVHYALLRKRTIFCILLITGLLCYLPALAAGFVIDDYGLIVRNPLIRSLANTPIFFRGGTFYGGDAAHLIGGFYRPLTVLFYAAVYQVVGASSFVYHLLYVLLHTANSLLVFLVIRDFLHRIDSSLRSTILSLLLTLIFVVHPIQVETVTYLSTQDMIPFFFGMSAVLLIITRGFTRRIGLSAALLIYAALLSKESGVIFLPILFCYFFIFHKPLIKRYTIWAIVLFILYTVTRCSLATVCSTAGDYTALSHMPFMQYLGQIPAVLSYYFTTFLFPYHLSISQHWVVNDFTFQSLYLPLMILIVFSLTCIATLLLLYARSSAGHAETKIAKTYCFFLLWFIISLGMYSHIIPIDFTVADHWFYVPMIGLLGMCAVIYMAWVPPIQDRRWMTLCIVIIALLGVRTHIRNYDWHDQYRLLTHDYPYSRGSYDIENNIGYELTLRNDLKGAEHYFKKAIHSSPDWPIAITNLGSIYETQKRYDLALEQYRIGVSKGRYYIAYEKYAALLIKRGRLVEARTFLKTRAIPQFPANQKLRNLLKQTN